ncbi:MAG: flagellar type III secretion system pore protein FliP [Bacillota bacterium]|jgi:flagellar biosynthetic protein FliP|nr:flagellar type III secretion system pore protein FliP [Candidatus Fermentithermobacillaceae bacterium]
MNSYSLVSEILKVAGFLGFLVACAIVTVRLRNRRFRPGGPMTYLQVIDCVALGRECMVCMVRAGRSILVLGLTGHNISLLKEIPKSELDEWSASQVPGEPQPVRGGGFLADLKRQLVERSKGSGPTKLIACLLLVSLLTLCTSTYALAAPENLIPNIDIRIDGETGQGGLLNAIGILAVLTVLALAPAILILTTSFTRIVIVFSFLRTGLGTQQTPPNQVLIGLALLLTFFVMAPTWNEVNQVAIAPYIDGTLTAQEALALGQEPLKQFMLRQTREKDLALFVELRQGGEAYSPEDLSMIQVVPAFAMSELKTAFEMGFILYLPFLVIDMVVASTLMSMGMLMLPPVLISLPFKLLLFVLVDGWGLVARSLIGSFR